jgi:CBS domain-containing protein
MKVRDIMMRPPQTCPATMSLPAASRRMHDCGCGTLIALDSHGRLAGILTDRDLALAVGRLDPTSATVADAMTRRVHVCAPDTGLAEALDAMARHKVRRLPAVTADGDPQGIISIDDITLWGVQDGVSVETLICAWRRICSAECAALDAAVDADR